MTNKLPITREALQDRDIMEAVTLGYVVKMDNRITPSRYSKIANALGLESRKKAEIESLVSHIRSDEDLEIYFNMAIRGEVGVEDLEHVTQKETSTPEHPIKNKGIHATVSPFIVANEEVLANNREFREAQRTGAHVERLFDGLKTHLTRELNLVQMTNAFNPKAPLPKANDKEVILGLSDWHVGARVEHSETGGYDYSILTNRVRKMAQEAVSTAKLHNAKHIHCFYIGDLIEHINMRNVNQAFEAEFPATEQIAKGIRLLVTTLLYLAENVEHVSFGIVGGNHDRFQGNKNDKVYNDNIAYLALDTLFLLQNSGGIPKNVTLIDNRADVYSFTTKVAGHPVKVVHGDNEAKKEDTKIRKHIRREEISYLMMGHIHTSRIIQEDYSRYHVYVGSTMGTNNYSTENNFPTTDPTQCILVLEKDKEQPIFKPVTLK